MARRSIHSRRCRVRSRAGRSSFRGDRRQAGPARSLWAGCPRRTHHRSCGALATTLPPPRLNVSQPGVLAARAAPERASARFRLQDNRSLPYAYTRYRSSLIVNATRTRSKSQARPRRPLSRAELALHHRRLAVRHRRRPASCQDFFPNGVQSGQVEDCGVIDAVRHGGDQGRAFRQRLDQVGRMIHIGRGLAICRQIQGDLSFI